MTISVYEAIKNLQAGRADAGMIPEKEYTQTIDTAIAALIHVRDSHPGGYISQEEFIGDEYLLTKDAVANNNQTEINFYVDGSTHPIIWAPKRACPPLKRLKAGKKVRMVFAKENPGEVKRVEVL